MPGTMKVQVLGVGCAQCARLYTETKKSIVEAGVEAELVKVENLEEIAELGVFMTPGLIIDGEIKSTGSVPKVKKIAAWLTAAAKKLP